MRDCFSKTEIVELKGRSHMTIALHPNRRLLLLAGLIIFVIVMTGLLLFTHGQMAYQAHSVAQSSPLPNIMYGN